MNDQSFIKQLAQLNGGDAPFTSLYLNTEARTEQGDDEIQLRWRGLRDRAEDAGASEEALEALDGIVPTAHLHGNGLTAIVAGNDIRFRRFLRTPIEDEIQVGPVPHLLPLLEWGQENPRHLALLIDRVGADIYLVHPDREVEFETVEGDQPDIGRTSRGGWSQPRFQRGQTKAWRDNAEEVAEELQRIATKEDVELVLLAGGIEALRFLKEKLPEQPEYVYHEMDGSRQLRLEDIEDDLNKAISAFSAQNIEQRLDRFIEERGQRDLAVEGVSLTLAALRKAQVDTLLIRSDGIDGTAFCSSSDPSQGSKDRNELEGLGLKDIVEAPASDVLVSGAIASGAKVRVVPDLSEAHGPREGVGGLLRYA